ncbi:hypothetical protein [Pseudoalteromonas arctica]|uniref:Uncharacterized protein n=1 Tax=Pseudoalteromonas arctica TaxID=394751 RepID=A0A7Y0DVR3_9GAMM|nr:hypothetical protein [Pseudoalteromonas arctica]NMM42480.1 hypothetical protein [Pseudoalteromonas arctica]
MEGSFIDPINMEKIIEPVTALKIKKNLERIDAELSLKFITENENSKYTEWEENKRLNRNFIDKGLDSVVIDRLTFCFKEEEVYSTNFFFLFHHNLYFTIPYIVCKNSKYKGACLIITEKSYDIEMLKKTSKNLGVEIEFIILDSKGNYLRKSKAMIKSGYALFILVDTPFGFNRKTIKKFDYNEKLFGLKYRDGYIKISKILNQSPVLLINDYNFENKIVTTSYKISTSDEVNKIFCARVLSEPEKFEKLNDFMQLFDFKMKNKTVNFYIDENQYFYNPIDKRLFLKQM